MANRTLIVAVLFATYFLTYLDRAVMATAIPFIAGDFALTSVQSGAVLSAFFFGYALMQLPSGMLADRFGPTRLLCIAVVCWSTFTAMTALAPSLLTLLLVRALFGFSEGPAPVCVSKTIVTTLPRERIGRSNGVVLAATLIGSAAAPTFVTTTVVFLGWRAAFLALLVPGLFLALAIYLVFLRPTASADPGNSLSRIPAVGPGWKQVFGSREMRWCVAVTFLASCANWGLQNWLPSYLLKSRGMGLAQMGLSASIPFAAGALGYLLGGYVGDRAFARRRPALISLCLLVSSLCLYAATVASTGGISIAFMTATFLLLSMAMSNLFTLPLTLMPGEVAGTAFGLVNTGAQLAGFLSPLLIGAVLDASNQNYDYALHCIVGVALLASVAATRIR